MQNKIRLSVGNGLDQRTSVEWISQCRCRTQCLERLGFLFVPDECNNIVSLSQKTRQESHTNRARSACEEDSH